MSTCGAAQWVILSESWPQFKFFNLQKMLKNLLGRKTESSQDNENRRFMRDGVDLFSARENKQSIVSGSVLES